MQLDVITIAALTGTLSTAGARKLFTTIANKRIAEKSTLRIADRAGDQELEALVDADLIGAAPGEKYFVTAKGLKVARDLEKIPG
jgi:hypothetical protein